MAVATVSEVATSLGRPIDSATESDQVQQWLDDAEMQVRLRLGDLTLLDQRALAYVEREAVVLKVKNPDGKKSEAIDDYNYGRQEDAARGQVYIIDDWWDMLTPDMATGAFTITPYSVPDVALTDIGWPGP
jgi:hypothetical protein